ncbi:unnamed protein product, partial [Mesorhabditis spiculigera]
MTDNNSNITAFKQDFTGKRKSNIWRHALMPMDGRAECVHCGKKITCSGGSTTGLRKHLYAKHSEAMKDLDESGQEPETTPKKKTRLGPEPNNYQAKCERAVLEFLVANSISFNVVDSPEFRNLTDLLSGFKFKPPTRARVSQELLDQEYAQYTQNLRSELSDTPDIGLSCDGWSSKGNIMSLHCVYAHYVDGQGERHSRLLGLSDMSNEEHTSDNILQHVTAMLELYDIPAHKIRSVTSDGASNERRFALDLCDRGFKQSGWVHCLAHLLQLIVNAGLKDEGLKLILLKVRKIMKLIKKSRPWKIAFEEAQQKFGKAVHRALMDCDTRWNTSCELLEFYIDKESALRLMRDEMRCVSNRHTVLLLNAEEKATMSQRAATIFDYLYIMTTLDKGLKRGKAPDSPTAARIHATISGELSARLKTARENKLVLAAAALNPLVRHSDILFEEEEHREHDAALLALIQGICEQNPNLERIDEREPATSKMSGTRDDGILELLLATPSTSRKFAVETLSNLEQQYAENLTAFDRLISRQPAPNYMQMGDYMVQIWKRAAVCPLFQSRAGLLYANPRRNRLGAKRCEKLLLVGHQLAERRFRPESDIPGPDAASYPALSALAVEDLCLENAIDGDEGLSAIVQELLGKEEEYAVDGDEPDTDWEYDNNNSLDLFVG